MEGAALYSAKILTLPGALLDFHSIQIATLMMVICASAGLLVLHCSNRLLPGILWLSGAFGVLAVGIIVLAAIGDASPPPVLQGFGLVCIQFSNFLIFLAARRVTETRFPFPKFGVALLALLITGCAWYGAGHYGARIVILGLTATAQAAEGGLLLIRFKQQGVLIPARFTAVLLVGFAAVQLGHAVAILLASGGIHHQLLAIYVLLSNTLVLGVSFGLFWMTTTQLRLEFEQMAQTDPLTGALNRRAFRLEFDREFARSVRSGEPLSVIVFDLDHFKRINDQHGHSAGDDVLCTVVERMQISLRSSDQLARLGGEEFAVLLPETAKETATEIAERLRGDIECLRIPHRGKMIRLTVSMGISTVKGDYDVLDDILRRGDAALYRAKAAGRNCVLVA